MKMKTKSLAIILIFFKFIINSDERLVVTGADEPVSAHAGEDVTLSCSVDTHVNVAELQVEWRKTDGDIIVLQYADGENKPESQDEKYSGRAEFFTEETSKGNFSMKLRKVRLEDKGEFMCEVHSDTDSNSTTARITALGYSPLHWLILGLCITVSPAVLLTGALSVRYYIKKSEGRQALLSHWSLVAVPSVMVSSAFLLWGVTDGSTEEAVTCTVITLLNILMLFNMDAKQLYPGLTWRISFLIQILGSIIIITAVCTGSVVGWTKNSATPAGKVILGIFIGEFVLMMIFLASMQLILYWFKIRTLKKTLWAPSVFLIIFFLFAVGVVVFLAIFFSGRADIGPFLTVFIIPVILFFISLFGPGIFLICFLRSGAGFYKLFTLFRSLNMMLYIHIILTLYIQLITWMQGIFLLGYFIPIIVFPLVICTCFIAKIFLESFRHFYLVQKILLGILFPLHLILSLLYLRLVLENDKERLVKICEFVFIYILIVTNNDDWKRKKCLAKPRKYVYFSGAFALPLLNSAALAVALKLKAETGKHSWDLRLIVLISGSVFLFSWFVIQMSAYYLSKKRM
ncbi:uncharacterized protein LOC125704423 isoform X2 [Brienomyrus brachyistius]|uniref:uncharacterized protein LOC125704423 isoform X2 n=1 Tax=Brienomyrus brachyistius TaxID=42636 RepID=UPI0020B2D07A|nr:uncharacterized protein LOC125704423 isoform X2 [Brienomyrus brachyistius]